MVAHCIESQPNEACGILAGRGITVSEIFRMTNIKLSSVSYLMDPAEQFAMMKELREKFLAMIAIYHSHPCGPAVPSSLDIEQACYEDAVHVIVSLAEGDTIVKAFSITGGKTSEVGITVEPQ